MLGHPRRTVLLPGLLLAFTCALVGLFIGLRSHRAPRSNLEDTHMPEGTAIPAGVLDCVVSKLDLDQVPFYEAIAQLQRVTGIRIDIERESVRNAVMLRYYTVGPEWADKKVSCHASQRTLDSLLNELVSRINDLNGGIEEHGQFVTPGLRYEQVGDEIVISAAPDLGRRASVVRNYDIRDLLPSGSPPKLGQHMKVDLLGAKWLPSAELTDQIVVPLVGLPAESVQVKAVPPQS